MVNQPDASAKVTPEQEKSVEKIAPKPAPGVSSAPLHPAIKTKQVTIKDDNSESASTEEAQEEDEEETVEEVDVAAEALHKAEIAQAKKEKQRKRQSIVRRKSRAFVASDDEDLPVYTLYDYQNDLAAGDFHEEVQDFLILHHQAKAAVKSEQARVGVLTAQVESLLLENAQLRSEKDIQDDDIRGLQEENNDLSTYIHRLELRERAKSESPGAATAALPTAKAVKSMKLPDPPVFGGNKDDQLSFDDWMTRLNNKLTANADHFDTELLKISYIVGRTTDKAAKHLRPRAKRGAQNPYITAEEVLDHLQKIYVNPNARREARRKFKFLRMRDQQNFHDFYTEFLHQSGEAGTPDDELVDELNDRLSFELQEKAIEHHLKEPTLDEFASHLARLDSELKAIRQQQDRIRTQAARNAVGSALPSAPRGAASPFPAAANGTSGTPSPRSILPRPNSSNNQRSPAGTKPPQGAPAVRPQYSDPEKQRLSRIGACFNCHQEGHLAKHCPFPKQVAGLEGGVSEEADKADEDGGETGNGDA